MKYLYLFLLLSAPAMAQVYKCEVNGQTTFSQVPCGENAELTEYNNKPVVTFSYQPFVATAYVVEHDEMLAEEAKGKIRAILKDPESAIFSDLITTIAPDNKNKLGICGNVNAKNSYGGYTGNTAFTVIEGEPHMWDKDGYLSGIDLNGSLKRQCFLKDN